MIKFMEIRTIPVPESGCFIWLHACNPNGYGHFCITVGGKKKWVDAHRASYIMHKGPIPKGMTVDHLCKVKSCVNPDHLECVTYKENNKRSNSRSAKNIRKTHCPKGHPLSGDNLYSYKGKRNCRTCRRSQSHNYNHNSK